MVQGVKAQDLFLKVRATQGKLEYMQVILVAICIFITIVKVLLPHDGHDDDDDGGGMSKRSLLSGGRNAIIDTWAPNLSHSNTLRCS